MERPWGIFEPVYHLLTSAICDTCGIHPKQHTKKRGALGNTKKTKITRRAGAWVKEVYEKHAKGSIQIRKEPYENH